MDRIKSLSESWRSRLNISATTEKLGKWLGRSPNSADDNQISTGPTIVGTGDTGIKDASVQAPIRAVSDRISDSSDVGAISMKGKDLY